ncbi:hypothetical protein Vadar_002364 [Vaccinium darrowii]|uniref:Uncharacterized protein n=1 Tax=Vaccinium darrowii TaxID=229202 RepID=A0ACB7XEV4_9ERIC|nr:hypothetical protein Vadar_002364 [Vaccinium darrowii]
MEASWRSNVVVPAMYLPLIAIFATGQSQCRELRPSDHGLAYQRNLTAPTADWSRIKSFFGDTPAPSPMPETKNMSDASWWKDVSGAGQRDQVKKVLAVVAVVCGATGVGFLVVAALVYVFRHPRQRSTGTDK